MDERRFDEWTRSLAGGASRRGVLRGLAGGTAAAVLALVRGGRARAQQAGLAPGAACTDTSQCSQLTGPTVCADNGYADDGALNCCRQAGGACVDATYSADCCGGLYCRGGVCTDLAPTGELPPGSYCTSSSQCSQEGGAVVCADNGVTSDGVLNCCRQAGGACSSSAGCCAGLTCTNGVCGGTPSTGAVALGGACASTAECAPSAAGSVICASNEIASDGALNCCLEAGGACGTDNSVCCGSNFCVDGVCGEPPFGDVAAGAICTATIECSQAAGPTVCGDNGIASDGALTCCRLETVTCASDAECCAGLLCGDNGVAVDGGLNCCAPTGGACGSDFGCCGGNFCVDGVCQAA